MNKADVEARFMAKQQRAYWRACAKAEKEGGCLEHREGLGDPLHAQHHEPDEHEGDSVCRCYVFSAKVGRCANCGSEVQLLVGEAYDPRTYTCAGCDREVE